MLKTFIQAYKNTIHGFFKNNTKFMIMLYHLSLIISFITVHPVFVKTPQTHMDNFIFMQNIIIIFTATILSGFFILGYICELHQVVENTKPCKKSIMNLFIKSTNKINHTDVNIVTVIILLGVCLTILSQIVLLPITFVIWFVAFICLMSMSIS